jgi:hypothetical protein
MLSLSDLHILIEALGTQEMEYGLSPESAALLDRLRTWRDERIREIERGH